MDSKTLTDLGDLCYIYWKAISRTATLKGVIFMSRYICFDVETPNLRNDRMSAIGICVVEDGVISAEYYSLVNPEEGFDAFNIQLTGITPDMAAEAPTFAELWPTLGPIMRSGLLVAHNAQFDMSVLSKCLRAYKIPCKDITEYACTCRMGKRIVPWMPNHKLDTMCRELNIDLNHHNAGSDARACAEILRYYISKGTRIEDHIRPYSLSGAKTLKK